MRNSISVLAIVSSCALPGCLFVADDDDDFVRRSDFPGTLVVDWTIDGFADPDECDQSDSAFFTMSVFTTRGAHVGDFTDDCTAFVIAVDLAAGSYYADALLEDPEANPRTTVASIEPFTIFGNDTLSIPVDFPASSFY
jgi:hypothetical protein